ncbi:MAG: cobalamin B12-binding domain-containing protein [Desulfuromonadales bacterium]|nr:cobalamin B12-binding domain-containing protein [Desulfuromonadales bacterium]
MQNDLKRVLLVHPLGYNAGSAKQDISRIVNIMPPLGLASIAAYLEREGLTADIIDCYAHPDSDSKIIDYLQRHRPAWIGFSCTTSSFLDAVRIAKLAKSISAEIHTVYGGPHVSALKEVLLRDYPEVDIAVIGEGEETLHELMRAGFNHAGSVPGLVCRNAKGEPESSGYRVSGLDLDTLPLPAYEKLEGYPEVYKLPIFNYPKAPSTSCISSRGCPYACSYCDRSVFQRTFRFNSADYLYRHLKYLREKFGIRHINFYDDQFTFQRQRVEDFCNLMINDPLGMTFNCAVRAEHIDFDLLKLMKAAGCWMVSLGIETGDEELLAQHRQNANLNMLADKIRLIKKAGIRTKGLLMMGLPGESEESIRRSMDYVFSLPIDDFNLAKFTPFPGSPIYETIHALGEFDEDWEKMDCMSFQFIPDGMTKERLEELFIRFYKTHFQRPKVLLGYIAMIWKSPDSWRRFLGDILGFMSFIKSNKRLGDGESQ